MASAPDIVQNAVGDFIANLAPQSAGAALLSHGMQLTFDRYGGVTVPAFTPNSSDAGYPGEGGVIPVKQPSLSNSVTVQAFLK